MTNHDADALVSFDFVHSFPHKTWVSTWSSDESYPSGFRYKLISARHENLAEVELIVLLQQRNGEKEVLKHLDIALSSFEPIASTLLEGLAEEYDLDFEAQDFSACRTSESFEVLAEQFGWVDR